VGLYFLPDRLEAQQYRDFLKVVLVEVPRNVTASLNATNPLQERGLTWLTDWMVYPRSPEFNPMNLFRRDITGVIF